MKLSGLLFLATTLYASAGSADWSVETRTDAMTDEQRATARVTNKAGHSFSVYRIEPNGKVWANFALSEGSLDQLAPDKPLRYRIDKQKPHEEGPEDEYRERRLGFNSVDWEPKWLNFLLWHGNDSEARSERLTQLMNGDKLLVRYYLSTGGYKDTEFTLRGAGTAIASALGITANVDPDQQAARQAWMEAAGKAARRCSDVDKKVRSACFSKVRACSEATDHDNAQAFEACMTR